MTPGGALTLYPVPGIPTIEPGSDLAAIVADAMASAGPAPADGDLVVVSQKVVSKAEGRVVRLSQVTPSYRAVRLAESTDKDPRLVEVVLSESRAVLRARPGLIICEHRLGLVMANAGVDRSNVGGDPDVALLLPVDPDASAAHLRARLESRFGASLGVIVSDSAGRAWRNGVVGLALGASGVPSLLDRRGALDRDGRALEVTQIGLADQVASAAALVMGEAGEGRPVVVVRGLDLAGPEGPAADLLRDPGADLFR